MFVCENTYLVTI